MVRLHLRFDLIVEMKEFTFSHNEIEAQKRGYYVMFNGQLVNRSGNSIHAKILSCGYKCLLLRNVKNRKTQLKVVAIHRLQAYQKFGDMIYRPGVVVRHLNGDKLDNSWDNISIGTEHDNAMDIPEDIRIKKARNAAKRLPLRYSPKRIECIKNDHIHGMSYSELMKKYHISSKGTISYICNHNYL